MIIFKAELDEQSISRYICSFNTTPPTSISMNRSSPFHHQQQRLDTDLKLLVFCHLNNLLLVIRNSSLSDKIPRQPCCSPTKYESLIRTNNRFALSTSQRIFFTTSIEYPAFQMFSFAGLVLINLLAQGISKQHLIRNKRPLDTNSLISSFTILKKGISGKSVSCSSSSRQVPVREHREQTGATE